MSDPRLRFRQWAAALRRGHFNNPFFGPRVYITLYLVSSAVLLPVSLNYALTGDWPVAVAIGSASLIYALLALEVRRLDSPGYTTLVLFTVASMVTLGAAMTLGSQAAFWLFPLILTAYLLFTLWVAVVLNGVLLLFVIPIVITTADDGFAVQAVATVALVSLFSSLFAYNVHHSHRELARLGYTDHLTGLLNRRLQEETVGELLRRFQEYGENCALVSADLDHFKTINDAWGHATGDNVLEEFANCLRSVVREQDQVFRVGGEEFMVVLPGADFSAARQTADRLRRQVEGTVFSGNLRLTVSCGIATPRPGETVSDWLRRADAALYAAKSNGRNRVEAA